MLEKARLSMSELVERKWSYQVREINGSISLLADNCKFGTLYGASREAERAARLIVIAPEMVKLLVDCAEFLEEHSMQCKKCSSDAAKLEEKIETTLVKIAKEYQHDS